MLLIINCEIAHKFPEIVQVFSVTLTPTQLGVLERAVVTALTEYRESHDFALT
jgi:hypothetical protein